MLLIFKGLGLSKILVSLFFLKWIITLGLLTVEFLDSNKVIKTEIIFGNKIEERS